MRLLFIIVFVGLLASFCSYGSALRVFDECDDTSSCPDGSKCVWRGCDGRKCICQNEKLPSPDSMSCVLGKDLGDACNIGDVCRGQPFSECLDSKCVCLDGYLLSTDKSHCVPRIKGNATGAEYGQSCSVSNVVCVFDLVCRMGTCGCPTGYRIATKEEMFAGPFDYRMCVPEGFSIGKPVDVNGPECRKPGTSAPTTTSSSSTTVTTTPTTTTTVTTTTTSIPSTPSTKPTTTSTTAPSTTSSTTSTTTSTPTTTTLTTTTLPSTTTTLTTTATPTTTFTTAPSTTTKSTPPSTTTTSTTKSTTTTATATVTPSNTPSQSTSVAATTTSQIINSTPSTSTTITTFAPKTPSSSSPPPSTTSHELSTQRSISTNNPSSTVTTISPSISTGNNIISNKTLSSTSHATITKYHSFSLPSNVSTAHMSASSTSSTSSTAASNLSSSPLSSPFTHSASSSSINTDVTTEIITTTLNSTVGLGDPCLHKACPDNSECVLDSCNVARCRCVLGYAESPDQEICWKLATLGEICGTERICQGSNTICSDRGICECESGFELSDSGRWCRLRSSWFIEFPVIGEECTGSFSSECYMYFEQECVNGKCRCKEGFREVGTIPDQNAVYPDTVQCRNASYDAGERETMMCSNQSKERRNHDVYDKAKSKIHKIQGAIIGGSVGFVAFLGIVIGILVLIRFKRKGRQRAIKDTSSTTSTDATSRYSFKIPRPFTHFVGSKEFDSTQIAYPNIVFDKNEREEPTITTSEPKPDVVNVGTLLRQSQNQT